MTYFKCFILLLLTIPSMAQALKPSPQLTESSQTNELLEVRERMRQAEWKALVADAADELEDKQTEQAYNRFEIWTGSLFGFFSVLITLLVIVFGFRTEKAAAAAATAAAQKELGEIKLQITRLLNEAEVASKAAGKEQQRARDHANNAERDAQVAEAGKKKINDALSIVESLSRSAKPNEAASDSMTPDDAEAAEQALAETQSKSEDDLTIEDFRIKIRDARKNREDRQKLLNLSSEMEEKYGHDEQALFFALLNKGEALIGLSKPLEAIKTFDRIFEIFPCPSEILSGQDLADVHVDKARALSHLSLFKESEEQFRLAIDIENGLYGETSTIPLWTKYWAAEAMVNQGDVERAESEVRNSLKLAKTVAGDDNILTLQLRTLMAKIALEQGDAKKAQSELREILKIQIDSLDEDSPYIDFVRRQLDRATQILNAAV